jgi:hypothetical protein
MGKKDGNVRMSLQTLRVLEVFLENPTERFAGAEVHQRCGMAWAHWLIYHAAHRAPESLSSRLEEEWLADLESRSSSWSRLRFALGCCWAILVIVGEYPRSRVPAEIPAASSAAAAKGFITLADRNFGYFSLRPGTLFLIAGLHAAVFYGLMFGFS